MYDMNKYLDESSPEMGEESSTESQETDTTMEDGQAEEQPSELSLEDQLDSVETGEDAPTGDILSMVNELGLIRDGLPVEYQSIDDIKEHLQKGFDYTAKTQELSEMRKQAEQELSQEREAFETERQQFEDQRNQLQGVINENDIMAEILSELQASDPDIFEEIASSFQKRMNLYSKQFNNPQVKALESKIGELEKSLGSKQEEDAAAKNGEIVKAWEQGLSEVQTAYAPKLKTLGVKPNWSEVQKVWQADASGNMTVKQAMLAVHGEDISKALEAKAKLAATKAKSSTRKGPDGLSGEGEAPQGNNQRYSLSAIEKIAAKHL